MRLFFIAALILLLVDNCLGQKRHITDEDIKSWPQLTDAEISNDGRYVLYLVKNIPVNSSSIVIISSQNDEKTIIPSCYSGKFSNSGNFVICQKTNDSLVIVDLRNKSIESLPGISEYKLLEIGGRELLLLKKSDATASILIRSFTADILLEYSNVGDYSYNSQTSCVFLNRKNAGLVDENQIIRMDLLTWKIDSIKVVGIIKKFIVDGGGKVVALTISDRSDSANAIMLLNFNDGYRKVITESSIIGPALYQVDGSELTFSKSGARLFFNVRRSEQIKKKRTSDAGVIWSYNDKIFDGQNLFLGYGLAKESLCCMYNIERDFAAVVDEDADIIGVRENLERYILVYPKNNKLWFNSHDLNDSLILYDTEYKTMPRKIVSIPISFNPVLSPDGKYILWYDHKKFTWISYNAESGVEIDLCRKISHPMYDSAATKIGRRGFWGLGGWFTQENSVFIYDEYDIWKVNLSDSEKCFNITKGSGRDNGLTFSLNVPNFNYDFRKDEDFVLIGYDRRTKKGGYWACNVSGNFRYDKGHLQDFSVNARMPFGIYYKAKGEIKKALKAKKYIVIRENASTSRNVYFTSDLKSYRRLSDISPELQFDWLKSELITWRTLNGTMAQGILYKPNNIDSSRKYPLIINYYEKRSDELHKFLVPEYSQDNINVPLFIDRGYLIFIPDISSSPGHNGEGSFNSIESAAMFLSSFRYIDSTKIGLQGHSYGGWQTNYMVTHSKRFKAACEVAGVSNQVSAYGQMGYGNGADRQMFYELQSQGSPYGFNVTPYNNPDLYIKNSPVFFVKEVMTPLLVVHNYDDQLVPFQQAIEFFLALRRQNKPSWLLQYFNGSGHEVLGEASKDFHNKMLDFFDYYMKSGARPSWMK